MARTPFELKGKRVFVAGHRGMVGSALVRRLASTGAAVVTAGRTECDLRNQTAVDAWVANNRPDAVFVAAAIARMARGPVIGWPLAAAARSVATVRR